MRCRNCVCLSVLFLLTSCGVGLDPLPAPPPDSRSRLEPLSFTVPSHFTIDPELRPGFVEFLNQAGARGLNLQPYLDNHTFEMKFGSLGNGSGTIGLCERRMRSDGTGDGIVTIDRVFWDRNAGDPVARRTVVDHELAHCLSYRPHRSERRDNGEPASLMFPSLFSTAVIRANIEFYLDELFSHSVYNDRFGFSQSLATETELDPDPSLSVAHSDQGSVYIYSCSHEQMLGRP